MESLDRPSFATLEDYEVRRTDTEYWRPLAATVLRRHGHRPIDHAVVSAEGTFPVVVADGRLAVKLYPPFFSGAQQVERERWAYSVVGQNPALPVPAVLASGSLFDDAEGWPWPYLLMRAVPGVSVKRSWDHMTLDDRLGLAAWLGSVVHGLHQLDVAADWGPFLEFLDGRQKGCVERHHTWGVLPPHLLAQLGSWLPTTEELVDASTLPRFLHGDIHDSHVLVRQADLASAGHWRPTGVIDLAEAMVGDPWYEWVAIHIGLFRCDVRLLERFMAAYGLPILDHGRFARRGLAFTLLHGYNVLERVPTSMLLEATCLDALAASIWGGKEHP